MARCDTPTMLLGPEPASVRRARQWLSEVLVSADPEVVDRALLCASELVSNAIEHAHSSAGVRIDLRDALVRVEVDDSSEHVPAVGHPGPAETRGRGLMIVDRCSDRWGIEPHQGGKTIWFELAVGGPQRGPMLPTPPR